MLDAAWYEQCKDSSPSYPEDEKRLLGVGIKAALRWLIENLPLPSLVNPKYQGPEWENGWSLGIDAVRHMFLTPEEPEERKLTIEEALENKCEHGIPMIILCPKCNPDKYRATPKPTRPAKEIENR